MEEKKFHFNLSNKLVFILVSLFLIGVLTGINNYYFYSHVERTSTRDAVQLEKLLNNYLNHSSEKNKSIIKNNLLHIVKTWSNYAYYNNSLIVKDLNNKVLSYGNKRKWDKSAGTNVQIDLKKLIEKKEGGFIIESHTVLNQVFDSVINSMTFSLLDIYADTTEKVFSKIDGHIISIDDVEDNRYDGIIIINKKVFEDRKSAKYITILSEKTLSETVIYIPAYKRLNVTKGMYIKKGELLYEGTIHSAINNFKNSYWYRSRPFIGFTIFTILILFLAERRRNLLEIYHQKQLDEQQDVINELEEEVKNNIEEKEEVLKKQNRLEDEYENLCTKFKEYEDFVKFAFVDTTLDELLDKNSRLVGTLYRLIAEKIVFNIYEHKIGSIQSLPKSNQNLDYCLRKINELRLLSQESINTLYAVKQLGNRSVHYSSDDESILPLKAIVVGKELILVIEEYMKLEPELTTEDKNSNNIKTVRKGIRIVKKK